MKAWPLLLAVCVLSGCKYGSHLEAATAASKYVADGGKSSETYWGTDYEKVEVPNPAYDRILKLNQIEKERFDAALVKCKSKKKYTWQEDSWLSNSRYSKRRKGQTLEEAKAKDAEFNKSLTDQCIERENNTHKWKTKKLPSKTKTEREPKKVQKTRQVDNISCLHEEELRQYVCVNRDEKKKYAYFKY
tara:strand:- start:182 stop:748 length:567 start_codon:yes stop_codon:yes gene_type:complete